MRRTSGRARQTPSLFEAGPAHSAPDASCLSFDTNQTPQQPPDPRKLAKPKLSASCPKKRRAPASSSKTAASAKIQMLPQASHNVESDACLVCGEGGTLIGCDDCSRVFHSKCVGIDRTLQEEERWSCPLHSCAGCHCALHNQSQSRNCISCAYPFCADCSSPVAGLTLPFCHYPSFITLTLPPIEYVLCRKRVVHVCRMLSACLPAEISATRCYWPAVGASLGPNYTLLPSSRRCIAARLRRNSL